MFSKSVIAAILSLSAMGSALPTAAAPEAPEVAARDSCHADADWTLSNLVYNANWDSDSTPSGTVSFTLGSQALKSSVSCKATSTQQPDFFYGGASYDCETTADGTKTSFKYDQSNFGTVTVSQSWSCGGASYKASGSAGVLQGCSESWSSGPDGSKHSKKCTSASITIKKSDIQAVAK